MLNLPSDSHLRGAGGGLFGELVRLSEPERAVWKTQQYWRSQPKRTDGFAIGWQTYLTGTLAAKTTDLPTGVSVRSTVAGVCITAGTEPGEASMGLAASVAEKLA